MNLVYIILAIGFVFYLNKDDGIDKSKLIAMGKVLDKEFDKRDLVIDKLEKRIRFLESELGVK